MNGCGQCHSYKHIGHEIGNHVVGENESATIVKFIRFLMMSCKNSKNVSSVIMKNCCNQ